MSFANYKQADARWGAKNYNGSSTMATAGCGPTSVANLAYAINSKVTPWTVAQYMREHGYAVYGNGTAWAGIPASMKHFGLTNVANIATMDKVWEKLKAGYKAIFLFKGGSRGGVCWTTAGHYITVTAYKVEGKKHWLWTRDPGGRNHTGWYCYEDHMKGLISQVWVGKVPASKTTTKKTKGQKITDMAVKCAWKYKTAKAKYKYPSGKRKKAYKQALQSAYGSRKSWGKQTRAGASCDVFVGTVIRASGVDKKFPRGLSEQVPYLKKSSKWKLLKTKKQSKLKKGDIIYQHYKTGGQHIMVYIGGGKVANAHYCKKTYPIIEKYSSIVKASSKCSAFRIYRAK